MVSYRRESVSRYSIGVLLAVKYEVIVEHHASFPYAVDLKQGAVVTITDRDEGGWAWCITHDERGAWIPKAYLRQINHTATMLVDYDSTELDLGIGDTLIGITVESGWLLCINSGGNKGWVPIDKVKKIY